MGWLLVSADLRSLLNNLLVDFFKDSKKDSEGQLCGLLAEDCRFEGVLVFEGILRIDGLLRGKIICRPDRQGTLVVGDTGRLELDLLLVDSLMMSGQFFGSGPIIALETANFHGNSRIEIQKNHSLFSSNLIVKDKSLFQGKSVMIRHESKETKSEIKRVIYNNRNKPTNLPFKNISLLKDSIEE